LFYLLLACEIVASRQARKTGGTEMPENRHGAARKNEDTVTVVAVRAGLQ